MNSVIILASLGVISVALTGLSIWYRSSRAADLGSVSPTWIAELRAGDPYDSPR